MFKKIVFLLVSLLLVTFITVTSDNPIPQEFMQNLINSKWLVISILGVFLFLTSLFIHREQTEKKRIDKHKEEIYHDWGDKVSKLSVKNSKIERDFTELEEEKEELEDELANLKDKQALIFDQSKITDLENAITNAAKSLDGTTKEFAQKTEVLSNIEESSKLALQQSQNVNSNFARVTTQLSNVSNFVQDSPEPVQNAFNGANDPSILAKVYATVELMKQTSNSNYQRDAAESLFFLQENGKISNREFLIASWVTGKTFNGSRIGKDMFNYVENTFPELKEEKEEE